MKFLSPLPYSLDALEPHISSKTLDFHYNKHHRGYAQKVEELIQGGPLENASLEDIIHRSFQEKNVPLFNNSAQVFNHTFYWEGLCSPQESCGFSFSQGSRFLKAVEERFGSLETLKEKLRVSALGRFGSGWAWLVLDSSQKDKTLEVLDTLNGEVPLTQGKTPLFVLDVWEHAYYLDYQNRRPDYVGGVLNHLVHWGKVEERFEKAIGSV
jgi:Fe-Mn family superoxide dismutase